MIRSPSLRSSQIPSDLSGKKYKKLNENESKEPQETTYVSAGDMLTAPWPCQVSTAPSTPSSLSTRAVALAFHGQLPTPSSTLCHTVPHGACLTELGICSTSCHPFSGGPWPLGLARPQAHSARIPQRKELSLAPGFGVVGLSDSVSPNPGSQKIKSSPKPCLLHR